MGSPDDEGKDAKEPDFDLHHPHDHFFRRAFGTAETASDYFLRVVPESLRRFVSDPARMRLENVSFISRELRGSQSDLLWRCEAAEGRCADLYLRALRTSAGTGPPDGDAAPVLPRENLGA